MQHGRFRFDSPLQPDALLRRVTSSPKLPICVVPVDHPSSKGGNKCRKEGESRHSAAVAAKGGGGGGVIPGLRSWGLQIRFGVFWGEGRGVWEWGRLHSPDLVSSFPKDGKTRENHLKRVYNLHPCLIC